MRHFDHLWALPLIAEVTTHAAAAACALTVTATGAMIAKTIAPMEPEMLDNAGNPKATFTPPGK